MKTNVVGWLVKWEFSEDDPDSWCPADETYPNRKRARSATRQLRRNSSFRNVVGPLPLIVRPK
ncbi:MAG TPA: hypothetical protein VNA25_02920 [Phycisphaerae bacterium]|nr:hypothetical protein [Phycisphaerae bacterium]